MEIYNQQELLQILEQYLHKFRKRLVLILIALAIGSIAGYYLSPLVMSDLFSRVGKVIFISPAEGFITQLKIALSIGVIFTLPLFVFQVMQIIKTHFPYSAAKHSIFLTFNSVLFFLLGATFAYFIVMPFGIRFLLGFATLELQPMLSAARYISFIIAMVFIFGIMFELPMVILLLCRMGVLSPRTLIKKRKYVILLIFIVAAVLTPPDVISQILMAIPLLILYELSIILARITVKKQ